MKVVVAGGVFRLPQDEIDRRQPAPEIVLSRELRARNIDVLTLPLESIGRLAFSPRGFVVHVHHLSKGALAAALSPACRPMVFTAHQTGLPDSRTRQLALRTIVRNANATVCLSETELAQKSALFAQAASRLHVIPNGIRHESTPPTLRALDPNGPVRLLFVGQLIELKRVDRILRALKEDARLTLRLVYHNDRLQEPLRDLAVRLGVADRVTFAGQRARDELRNEYESAHLLVLPSDSEALPTVVTEALSSGLPVVASDTGGVADQVRQAGRLIVPADGPGLSRAIGAVLCDYDSYARAALIASTRVRTQYSIATMIDRHLALYSSLLEGR